jgi:hypothetical protein
VTKRLLKALGKELPIPTAIGLERDGEALIKPFCPPYYRNMEEAVLAFVDRKYAQGTGAFRDGGVATSWQDGPSIQAGIPLRGSCHRRYDCVLRLRVREVREIPCQ